MLSQRAVYLLQYGMLLQLEILRSLSKKNKVQVGSSRHFLTFRSNFLVVSKPQKYNLFLALL